MPDIVDYPGIGLRVGRTEPFKEAEHPFLECPRKAELRLANASLGLDAERGLRVGSEISLLPEGNRLKLSVPGGLTIVSTSSTEPSLTVSGSLSINGNATVNGGLTVLGAQNLIKVRTKSFSVSNDDPAHLGDRPGAWQWNYPGEFAEVYSSFVVFQGFTIVDKTSTVEWNPSGIHYKGLEGIVQEAFVRIVSSDKTKTQGIAYCSEAHKEGEYNNTILFTVVVLGRGSES